MDPGTKGSLPAAAWFTCVLPTSLLAVAILAANAMSGNSEFLSVGFRMMLYFIVPPIFLATAFLAVFVRDAPPSKRFTTGAVVALGLPLVITFGWLATGIL